VSSQPQRYSCAVLNTPILNLIDPHVKAQIRKGVSVIKPDWIFESIKRKKALPLIKEWVG
jgi:hypothetical protein